MTVIKRGPFKGKKIVIGDQSGVDADPEGVRALLDLMGIEGALVTDGSRIHDFLPSDPGDRHPNHLRVPIGDDGIMIAGKLTFLEALMCIREFQPSWPKPATRQ